uniref:Uncharacterized protein n=1 Tax=Opuntia streptacantha TaxID=393608 RepID=A0A7C8YIX3_OPUST
MREPQRTPPSPCKQRNTLPHSRTPVSAKSRFPSMDNRAKVYLRANSGHVNSLIGSRLSFGLIARIELSTSFLLPRLDLASPSMLGSTTAATFICSSLTSTSSNEMCALLNDRQPHSLYVDNACV